LNDTLKSDFHLTYNRFEKRLEVKLRETRKNTLEKTAKREQEEGVISFRRKLNDIHGRGRGNHQEYSEPNGHVMDY